MEGQRKEFEPGGEAVEVYVAEMIRSSAGGVVGMIAAESLVAVPEKDIFWWAGEFFKQGFRPQGRTLEMVKRVLGQAPVKKNSKGEDRVLDWRNIPVDVLGRIKGEELFKTVPGRGLQVTARAVANIIGRERERTEALDDLLNFRADNLLLGLYAAGCDSYTPRGAHGLRPRDLLVRYPHNDGTVTLLRMNTFQGNELSRLAEDAVVRTRGKF